MTLWWLMMSLDPEPGLNNRNSRFISSANVYNTRQSISDLFRCKVKVTLTVNHRLVNFPTSCVRLACYTHAVYHWSKQPVNDQLWACIQTCLFEPLPQCACGCLWLLENILWCRFSACLPHARCQRLAEKMLQYKNWMIKRARCLNLFNM